ncbi:MAG: hypothetical protein ACOVP8_12325 [Phycisphaerales bacterium]|jgi:hypothetical protein
MKTEPQHIWLPELGYFVVATPSTTVGHAGQPLNVNFALYKAWEGEHGITFDGCPPSSEYSECDPVVSGYVKWDGCSNWTFDDCVHFCERDGPLKLATAMAACHDHANELFGGFA